VQQVADGVNDDRTLATLDRNQPLHAQQIRAAHLAEQAKRRGQTAPGQRPVEAQHEAAEPRRMARRVGLQRARRGKLRVREQEPRRHLAVTGFLQRGGGVQRTDLRGQGGDLFRGGEVGLAEHDPVGDRHLPAGLGVLAQRHAARGGIGQRDDGLHVVLPREGPFAEEGLQHRHRVVRAGKLQHHALEGRHGATCAVGEQRPEGLLEVRAHRAAEAPVAEQGDLALGGGREQRLVDADLAELVHHDGGVAALLALEQGLHQRGLARAEEAGDEDDGHPRAAGPALPPAEGTGRGAGREDAGEGCVAGHALRSPSRGCRARRSCGPRSRRCHGRPRRRR
jgi:hypothetical protein